jgi:RNA-directed DNA polymerase
VEKKMTEAPEPKDKLDAATALATAVSGPEDAALHWRQVDRRRVEADVRRLRQRIFTASKARDLKRVRRLQKLMLRSRANTLVSVRRVTERNAGRLTAGVDGEVVLTPGAKMQLVDRLQHNAEPFKPAPVRRVYIPKRGSSSTKRRPFGDSRDRRPVPSGTGRRCAGARVGARFEPRSYGFRPGRAARGN